MKKLTRTQLKNVMGGDAPYSGCSASCGGGNTVSITNCNGTCTATDMVGAKCEGATATLTKCCGGGGNCTP